MFVGNIQRLAIGLWALGLLGSTLACGGAARTITDPVVPATCAAGPPSSLVANVRDAPYSAKGDGVTDDTGAIQSAVNAVGGTGGTVLIPDGTYLINTVAQNSAGIVLKSRMTLKLASNAVLQAIPNASSNYAIISANNVSQVSVVGGTLIGDRSSHTGTTGEWGMGLSIAHAQQVVVDGVTARECWGDGFIVTSASSNVAVCNVTSSHNRRQGLTITSVDGMVVRNSNFSHSQGTSPETGINVEPNSGETVNNVLITGCTLANNAGGGFQCGTALANVGSTSVTGLVLDQNLVTGNGLNPVLGPYRVAVYMTVFDGAQITNNQVVNNIGQGICLTGNATHTMVKGNTVQGTMKVMGSGTWTGIGILISTCSGSTISSNTVTGNAGPGIEQIILDPTVTISNNTVSGNGS